MHLCFDGQEPPSSLHIFDGMAACHASGGSDRSHEDLDVDVDVLGAALTKKDASDQNVEPAPIADVVLLLLPPPRGDVIHDITAYVPKVNRPYLHLPPLRGPPV